jgi:hypothetical protein
VVAPRAEVSPRPNGSCLVCCRAIAGDAACRGGALTFHPEDVSPLIGRFTEAAGEVTVALRPAEHRDLRSSLGLGAQYLAIRCADGK